MSEPRLPYDANPVLLILPMSAANDKGYNKETVSTFTYVAPDLSTPIYAKCYMSRSKSASVVYATIWASGTYEGEEVHMSGSGTAGGYGYHKESAAIDEAFQKAGVVFTKHFGGCGEGSIRVAMIELAKALGYEGGKII